MTSRDFCYWCQGFFELTDSLEGLSPAQVKMIRAHLNLVFLHEIDPSIDGGKPDLVHLLNETHAGKPRPPHAWDARIRC